MLHSIDVCQSLVIIVIFTTAFLNDSSCISILLGDNYADGKDKILLTLGCIDLDLALYVDEPPIPIKSSTPNEKATCEWWEDLIA